MTNHLEDNVTINPIAKLTRDLRSAATTLGVREVRYLVDLYYQMQAYRIRAQNNVRASQEDGEPNETVKWAFSNFEMTERGIKSTLDAYTKSRRPGRWLQSIHGIGPVIAAGVLVYINPDIQQKCSQTWSYFGMAPGQKRKRGEKGNWNPNAKVLAWKAGQSFVMQKGSDKDYYGKIYTSRKLYEQAKNENLDYADQARRVLAEIKIGEDTEARWWYEKDMLPPGHIDARCRRYAAKFFLAHSHHVVYEDHHGQEPPKPFVIEHLGHVGHVPPPNWPIE